jgi:hypothetical protein
MSNDWMRMDKELERMWKEAGMSNLRYCRGLCLKELRKTSARIVGVPTEIWTMHLSKTKQGNLIM